MNIILLVVIPGAQRSDVFDLSQPALPLYLEVREPEGLQEELVTVDVGKQVTEGSLISS